MTIDNQNENIFYLGFNKKTGQMVEVVPPKGTELLFGPEQFKLLNEEKLDPALVKSEEEKKDRFQELQNMKGKLEDIPLQDLPLKEQLSLVWIAIRENAIPEKKLILADKLGHTSCGGSCGGIPFWMCG